MKQLPLQKNVMTPHKKSIKDRCFYLYGYENPSAVEDRILIPVKKHCRILKEEITANKTA